MPGLVEEDLGHHHRPVAAHRDQMSFAQLLMHFGHRNAEQLGDIGQVVDGLAGVKNVVAGRNAAHRTSLRPGSALAR